MVKAEAVFVIWMLWLISAAVGSAQERATDRTVAGRVAYCKVVAQPAKYDQHVLRIEGVYRRGGEIMSFHSPSCPGAHETSWVEYSPELRKTTSPELMQKMDKLLGENGRVRIVAVAEFSGPKAVDIPLGTPPDVADIMRGTNARYGHRNQFENRVRLLKVIAVEPVPGNTPWPN